MNTMNEKGTEKVAETLKSKNLFVTQDGIEIKLKRVAPMLLQALQKSLPPPPKPPMVMVEFNGRMEREENPSDPDYLERVKRNEEDRSMAIMDYLLQKGTELPFSDEEIDQMFDEIQSGIDIAFKGDKKLVVLKSLLYGDDVRLLMEAVQDATAVTERVVQEKIKTF